MQSRVGAARSSQQLSALSEAASLSKLTSREWEIIQHLLAGDRVPAIAKSMYLSQSTVRSHLSHVFAKLEVTSQQELINRFRDGDDPSIRS
jgi:DNA-binding NarL/FixJ family response regulator